MSLLRKNLRQRRIDASPFGEQMGEHWGALRREPVEALFALIFLAPFAEEQPLGLEATQQGIQRAFVDL
jgi:hypothetical protein